MRRDKDRNEQLLDLSEVLGGTDEQNIKTLSNGLNSLQDTLGVSFLVTIEEIIRSSGTQQHALNNLASVFYTHYKYYIPVWTKDRLIEELYRTTSIGNANINMQAMLALESSLKNAGYPSIDILFSSIESSPKLATLPDVLLNTDKFTRTADGTNEGESTGKTTTTTEDSGDSKQWVRSRPINYKTTDETTADSVQGADSTNNTNSDVTNTANTNGSYTENESTTRNRSDKNLLKLAYELQKDCKDIWQMIIEASGYMFLNCYSF